MRVLGKVGLANRGTYSASKTYTALDFVLYNGSTFVALKEVTGVTPVNDGVNWQYMALGTAVSLHNDLTTETPGEFALDAAQGPEITNLIGQRAPESHAATTNKYGQGNANNYGHVKLSDTYTTSVSGANAAGGVGASQNALYNAYANRAPINHATTATTYGMGTASNYGHVKLSDTYASKVTNGAAANGLAASQNALHNVYGFASHAKVLWSGTYYMTDKQTITLSEKVSAQPHGIVLHWTAYVDGKAKNYDNNYFFIPKIHIASGWSNTGCSCVCMSGGGNHIGIKYVYVHDTTIVGNSDNNFVGTRNNVDFKSNYWVLARVIGV